VLALVFIVRWLFDLWREIADEKRRLEIAKLRLEILEHAKGESRFDAERAAILDRLFPLKADPRERVTEEPEKPEPGATLPVPVFGKTLRQQAGAVAMLGGEVCIVVLLFASSLASSGSLLPSLGDGFKVLLGGQVFAFAAAYIVGRAKFFQKRRVFAALAGAILPALFVAAGIGLVLLGGMIASPAAGTAAASAVPATAAGALH